MRLQVNGSAVCQPEGITMLELIQNQGLRPERVAVECNGQIVRRGDFAKTALSEGDAVEIVQFVGGG